MNQPNAMTEVKEVAARGRKRQTALRLKYTVKLTNEDARQLARLGRLERRKFAEFFRIQLRVSLAEWLKAHPPAK